MDLMPCTTLAALGMPNFRPLCFWELVSSLTMMFRWRGWIKKHFLYTSSLSDQGINLSNIGLKCSNFSIIKALKLWSQIIAKLSCRIQWCHLTKNMTWDDLNTFLVKKDLIMFVLDFLGFLDDEIFMGNMFLLLVFDSFTY